MTVKTLLTARLSRFDSMVLLVILALIAALGLTILLGDHVGVLLLRTSPTGMARSTSWITIQFSEAMNRESVVENLRLEPPVQGEFSWSGNTVLFRPTQAMRPGTDYTVVLEAGASSETGREVLAAQRFTFAVRSPRVAYLAPADGTPQNIWIVDPAHPDTPEQVTYSPSGIFNYNASSDGSRIAFAEHNTETNGADIKLLNLETSQVQRLTDCASNDCTTPVWRPDDRMIAYERIDYDSELTGLGVSPTRVWLIDLTTTPPGTRPLFADSQMLGYGPLWSPDGDRIAVYDTSSQGILVYDFEQDDVSFVPSRHGTTGDFSPDGTSLVFPEVILTDQGARSYLQIANLETRRLINLSQPSEPIDDERAVWNPDGQHIAIARRYLDERHTPGRQIYLVNLEAETVEPLVVDADYYNGFFAWDPTGRQLVIQRFPQPPADEQVNARIRPEIWVYDLESGDLNKVADNAFFPRWMP